MKRILEKKFRKIITLEDEMLQTLDDIIENFDYVINPNCNKKDILAALQRLKRATLIEKKNIVSILKQIESAESVSNFKECSEEADKKIEELNRHIEALSVYE